MTDARYQEDEPNRKAPRRPADEDDEPDVDIRRRQPDIGADAGMRLLLPVGRSAWAIAAGYLGLMSVMCVPAPLALFCGIMAVREMRRDPSKHGMSRAIFGIVMGGIGTALLLFGLVGMTIEALRGGPK